MVVRKQILVESVEEAEKLVQTSEHLDAKLFLIEDDKVINVKSLLGVMSLRLGEAMMLEIRGNLDSRAAALSVLRKFIID